MLNQELEELWSFSYGYSGRKHWFYDGIFTPKGFVTVGYTGTTEGLEDGLFVRVNDRGQLEVDQRYDAARFERNFSIVSFKGDSYLIGGWVHYPTGNRFDSRIFETDLDGSFY